MKQTGKAGASLLLGAAVMSLALLSGPVASASVPDQPGALGLEGPSGKPEAGFMLAGRETPGTKDRAGGKTKKPRDKKPDDITWPVPICKPGPGCPP